MHQNQFEALFQNNSQGFNVEIGVLNQDGNKHIFSEYYTLEILESLFKDFRYMIFDTLEFIQDGKFRKYNVDKLDKFYSLNCFLSFIYQNKFNSIYSLFEEYVKNNFLLLDNAAINKENIGSNSIDSEDRNDILNIIFRLFTDILDIHKTYFYQTEMKSNFHKSAYSHDLSYHLKKVVYQNLGQTNVTINNNIIVDNQNKDNILHEANSSEQPDKKSFYSPEKNIEENNHQKGDENSLFIINLITLFRAKIEEIRAKILSKENLNIIALVKSKLIQQKYSQTNKMLLKNTFDLFFKIISTADDNGLIDYIFLENSIFAKFLKDCLLENNSNITNNLMIITFKKLKKFFQGNRKNILSLNIESKNLDNIILCEKNFSENENKQLNHINSYLFKKIFLFFYEKILFDNNEEKYAGKIYSDTMIEFSEFLFAYLQEYELNKYDINNHSSSFKILIEGKSLIY